jgi:putative peptide zinc metalloprotease protein
MTTASLPLARSDLQFAPLLLRGERYWTVKDPIARRYYQLREEEYFLLQLLDGQKSHDEIVRLFEARFAPRRLRRGDLVGFVGMLHREGLTVASALGQSEHLLAQRDRRRRQRWLALATNVLAIRLPGINPNRWLERVVPRLAWLVSPVCGVLYVVLLVSALLLVCSQFDALAARLPRFRDFFSGENLLWLAVSLALVKSLHELGHAFACKYFGGECNRLGIMLIAFTPALYCDVSDAWLLPKRWQRIVVSGAGMIVELGLAAAATWLWATTNPGLLNSLALNVMFVCSVGTLVINGNPLLRFDGYYMFADWLGVPNLQQQSSDALYRTLGQLVAGVPAEPRRPMPEPSAAFLLSYAVLAGIYRTLVVAGLLWFVYALLEPRGLAIVAQAIIAITVLAIVSAPVLRLKRFLSHPTRRNQVNRFRLTLALVVLAGLVAAVLAIPVPQRVTVAATVQPAGATHVYVTSPGVLLSAVAPGEKVAAGETIARLQNRELEIEQAALTSRRDRQRLHLEHLKLRQHDVPSLASQIPAATAALTDLSTQVEEVESRLRELHCTAPRSATVLAPRRVADAKDTDELTAYSGTPLDPANAGCYLETGTLLCTLGDLRRLEAVAYIEEAAAAQVRPGQTVRLKFAQRPAHVLTGKVERLARATSQDLSPELVAEGLLPVEQLPGQPVRPLGVYYQATIALDPVDAPLSLYATGQAKISVAAEPLGKGLYRSLRQTFRWPW